MDKVIIKSKKEKAVIWKPVMVKSELFEQIEELANITRKRKCDVVETLLKFALERVEIEEEN